MKDMIKKFIAITICLFAFCFSYAQSNIQRAREIVSNRGEVQLLINTNNISLSNLSKIVSISNRQSKDSWLCYANKKELETLINNNISFTVFERKTPKSISMATDTSMMSSWNKYPTYSTYVQMMQGYAQHYSNVCKLDTIGYSTDNRLLLCLKLSSNNQNQNKPKFFYSSSIHGDEVTGAYLMLRLIDYMLKNQQDTRVSNLLNNMQIFICPFANPDGTYAGGNNDVSEATRYNANYIDINRNFPDPIEGQHPDNNSTQIETQAFMNYAINNQFDVNCNLHGGSEVVNYPFDCWTSSEKTHADRSWFESVGNAFIDSISSSAPSSYFTDVTSSGVVDGGDWYTVNGGRQDYHTYLLHQREVTIEVSSTKMPQSESLSNYWTYLKSSLLTYMERSVRGFCGVTYDSITNQPISNVKIEINNHDRDNSEIYSKNNGYYFRPVLAGSYSVTFSKEGYLSKTINISYNSDTLLNQDVYLSPTNGILITELSSQTIKIYPTCCKDNVNIDSYDKGVLELFSLTGEKLLTTKIDKGINMINLNNLHQGQYFIRIILGNKKQYNQQISVIK
jgi:hypothetical protein